MDAPWVLCFGAQVPCFRTQGRGGVHGVRVRAPHFGMRMPRGQVAVWSEWGAVFQSGVPWGRGGAPWFFEL
ncbi:hypothetical protein R1flu_016041 [Riccia fluitans]|uniref:Uncharacterized protein n=1 Tax=Riccia fluitans TaxID=41844 RepID=A0ABD1YKX7_9MARC